MLGVKTTFSKKPKTSFFFYFSSVLLQRGEKSCDIKQIKEFILFVFKKMALTGYELCTI